MKTTSTQTRDLIKEDYCVIACPSEGGLFLVAGKKHEKPYRTNGITMHCNCPSPVPCCHLRDLNAIVRRAIEEKVAQAANSDDPHRAVVLLQEAANLNAQWIKCFEARAKALEVASVQSTAAQPLHLTPQASTATSSRFAAFQAQTGRYVVKGLLSRKQEWETASSSQIRMRETAEKLAGDIRKSARYSEVKVVCLAGERRLDIAA